MDLSLPGPEPFPARRNFPMRLCLLAFHVELLRFVIVGDRLFVAGGGRETEETRQSTWHAGKGRAPTSRG